MNLFRAIRNFFAPPPPPPLRNRPGGLAMIRRFGSDYGAEVLAGRIVVTVRLEDSPWVRWELAQPQSIVLTSDVFIEESGVYGKRGQTGEFSSLGDDLLVPLPGDPPSAEEVCELYALPTAHEVFTS